MEYPATLSSYLNINVADSVSNNHLSYSDGRAPARGLLELGINLNSLVLEGFGSYTEDRGQMGPTERPFNREDTRLIKDFPNSMVRTQMGDLIYPITHFQLYKPMAGFALTKQFSMQPSQLTYPSGNYEIFLKRPAKVYVWVNEQLHQLLDLPAGKHQLKEFPFNGGANDIRLEIIDDVGRQETLNYSYFSNTELLKKNLHQYNYALGALSSPYRGDRSYENNNLLFSGFHRYGFSDHLTLGVNAQTHRTQSVLGMEGVLSTKFGFFKFEPALHSDKDIPTGWALLTKYLYLDYNGPFKTQRSYNLGVTFYNRDFTQLELPFADIQRYADIAGSLTRGISKYMSMSIGMNYQMNRKNKPDVSDSFSITAGLNRRWDNGITTSLTARHSQTVHGGNDLTLLGFLLWSFPKDRQVVTASHSSSDNSSHVNWTYNPSNGAGSSIVQAGINEDRSEKGYNGQIQYNGNRMKAIASHEVTIQKQQENLLTSDSPSKNTLNTTTLQLSTALVFADGHFAISRPVTDSFAIINNTKNLSAQKIRLNPQSDDSYTAITDELGSAVAPELSSYNLTTLHLGSQNLPQNTALPRDHFNLYPTYKSGYVFHVGTDAIIYLGMEIHRPDGAPLSSSAGYIIPLTHKEDPPILIFTNREGLLRSEGFKPGKYRLEIATDIYEPIEFTLSPSTPTDFDLGVIQLKQKGL